MITNHQENSSGERFVFSSDINMAAGTGLGITRDPYQRVSGTNNCPLNILKSAVQSRIASIWSPKFAAKKNRFWIFSKANDSKANDSKQTSMQKQVF